MTNEKLDIANGFRKKLEEETETLQELIGIKAKIEEEEGNWKGAISIKTPEGTTPVKLVDPRAYDFDDWLSIAIEIQEKVVRNLQREFDDL